MLVSSANRKKFRVSEIFGRPLIYIKNNRGPRTEPCGTPQEMGYKSEDSPLKYTYCFLPLRYDWNHFKEVPLIP